MRLGKLLVGSRASRPNKSNWRCSNKSDSLCAPAQFKTLALLTREKYAGAILTILLRHRAWKASSFA
eukprot:7405073-Pyramimonas_sp.AAC.1